jgi:hypothetical protein
MASRSPDTSAVPESRGNSPRIVTVRTVERLVAAAPTLPGAVNADRSPAPGLRDSFPMPPENPQFVRRIAWSTAPGTVAGALADVASRLPAGVTHLTMSGWGGNSTSKEYWRNYAAVSARWRRPSIYYGLTLDFVVTQIGDRVGLGVAAEATWLQPRVAEAYVPRTVAAARAVVERYRDLAVANRHGAPTVKKTLDRHDARHFAQLINHLPADRLGMFSCPPPIGKDTLTFNDVANTTVTIGIGCGYAEIAKNASDVASLGFGTTQLSAVDVAVLRAMGLPSDYGR